MHSIGTQARQTITNKPRNVPMNTRITAISGLLLTSALLLSACGDDSSSSNETPPPANSTPVAINSTNATSIARAVLSTSSESTATSDMNPYAKPGTTTSSHQTPLYQRVFDLALNTTLTALRSSDDATALPVGVVTVLTVDCVTSGTMTISSNDADNDGTASVGDSYTTTFNKCTETGLNQSGATETTVSNGTLSFTLKTLQGDPDVANTSWSLAVGFNADMTGSWQASDGSSGSNSLKGGATLAASYDAGSTMTSGGLSGSSVKDSWNNTLSDGSVDKGSTEVANFNFTNTETASDSSYTADIDFTLRDSEIDGSVTVNTNPVFSGLIDTATGNTNPPTAGTMVITGGDGTKLTLVANSDGTVTLTVNNDPAQTYTYTWAELGGW